MPAAEDTHRYDNERRVARMRVWINLAKTLPASEDHAHVRFVLYWIAYEAAYQVYKVDGDSSDKQEREDFHRRVTWYDGRKLQATLSQHRESIVKLLGLRQAHPSFWYRGNQRASSTATWEAGFRSRVRDAVSRLDNLETASTLNDLFRNLSIVRNQIVHGGSAGIHGRGRTQVLLGAVLLGALVPRFCDSIESNLDEEWGIPPFPRVGTRPDDDCPPPWLVSPRAL